MGLAGIAAVDRYRWGFSGDIVLDYDAADEQGRIDFDNANASASEIDPHDEHHAMTMPGIWRPPSSATMMSGKRSNGSQGPSTALS
jgi:hypothetical protein